MHYRFLAGALMTGATAALGMMVSGSAEAASIPETTQMLAQQHPAMNQVLQQGSVGHWVATLQADLYLLGYHSVGTDDGIFGPKTLAALKAFQENNGFAPTGVTSPPVWQDILAGFNLTPRYTGPMTISVNVPPINAQEHPALYQRLSIGSQGHWVATLQADLKLLGYTQVGPTDGIFGPKTQAAVEAFQRAQGLTPSGVTTYDTWKQILIGLGILAPNSELTRANTAQNSVSTTTSSATTQSTQSANVSAASQVSSSSSSTPSTIDGRPVIAVYHMRATAYGPSLKDNYPYGPVDAFGQPLEPGMIAVDPSLIPLKSYVYVTGYTDPNLPAGGFLGRAMDTGGAIVGHRIDIFMDANSQTVSNFGIEPVTVYVLGK
ncbi:peptidoglycan-binding protein [Sulfobacillus thermosulfidooxidans]|uniref:peptidoglycan-binding protein n=1 Tax=Sulfobacillus thermosulfidooxidans TaxID=28034 RepID=UPI00031A6127|nr:peptidoglycan-binding protein [Sulfobacillus thermosulfidooxidans]